MYPLIPLFKVAWLNTSLQNYLLSAIFAVYHGFKLLLIDCQPDAQLVAEEEAKRLKELQKEEERGRREQLEKAHVRGSHALKMVHLAQVSKVEIVHHKS